MKRFELITKYIDAFDNDSIGEWIIDNKSKGTPDDPIHMPFVSFSDTTMNFIQDAYACAEKNKDLESNRYKDNIAEKGINPTLKTLEEADVSDLDEKTVFSMVIYALRADRFCEGALLGTIECGAMKRWLIRLKEIDDTE